MFRNMFKKTYVKIDTGGQPKKDIPEGLWRKCKKCSAPIYVDDVRANFYVCPKCGGYFRVHAYRRIEMIADPGSFVEWDKKMPVSNPLDFPGYEEKLEEERKKAKLNEAVVIGRAQILGNPCVLGVCDSRFMMSSMGRNVGEKITAAIERAMEAKLPVIIFACSGGARMQEGMISLMQMAKTSAALKRYHDQGGFFISFLTNPTMGGVSASFAMLGDIILAEPKALIGFAGPRVIAQTIGARLPEGFQSAEFMVEHGFVDSIVERKDQREVLGKLLAAHAGRFPKEEREPSRDLLQTVEVKPKEAITPWDIVLLSRKNDRPVAWDYIHALFDGFFELHGDRLGTDDGAIVGGLAGFQGRTVMVIGEQKGHNLRENKDRNFGMPLPGGYRKALRLMEHAGKYGMPVICFIDTPGAFCGLEAEENGQAAAIARSLMEMSALPVPVLSVVIGEGGSGGALALGVANQVWMLEHAIYSVLSPEGFAAILYRDGSRVQEAAQVMKITADSLLDLGIIDGIIKENIPLTVETMGEVTDQMVQGIEKFLKDCEGKSGEALAQERYQRFRKY